MVIKEVLEEGRELLRKNNIDEREARLLLAYAMGIDFSDLIIKEFCTDEEYKNFLHYLEERISGKPYAYIVGYKEFMKLKFKVNSNVLIPREDTEILAQEVINEFAKKKDIKILDMCTGSGCIAISLAKYLDITCQVDAVDLSTGAIETARENSILNGVTVNFINSDLFENVVSKYDVIVSNPPYIKKDDIKNLQAEVKREPMMALDGGEDGLLFYREIALKAKGFLVDGGSLVFEIGFDEANDVSEILKENGYEDITVIKDFGGNDRVIKCKTRR